MTYNVQLGSGGYLGWKILERTADRQRAAFEKSTEIQSSRDYFAKNITKVENVDDLVSDYKLLKVALRAFGLDGDIRNRAFIKKVMEADQDDKKSIVNRLTDKRYLELNQAFKFGSKASSQKVDVQAVSTLYLTRSFEKSIGESHEELELALNAQRELPRLVSSDSSENTKWYSILSSTALRTVFEGAFGLPDSFSQLPVDRQLQEIKSRAERMIGTSDPAALAKAENMEKLIKRYLILSQTDQTSPSSRFSTALTLLRGN